MQLIEEAVLDAYTEEEQAAGFLTMIEEHLALPFSVKILGVDADVERVDMTLDGQIVGICRRGKTRQKITGILASSIRVPPLTYAYCETADRDPRSPLGKVRPEGR